MNKPTCSAEGCEDEARISDMCAPHYRVRIGLPADFSLKPKFADRFWSYVKTGPECWEWQASKINGYGRMGGPDGETVYAHRYSYEHYNGPIAEGMFIDHLCHNPGCVNPEHLREVTPKQNTEHRYGANPNNTSGAHGVHWRKDIKKWQALVHCGDKNYHCGYFTDIEEAKEAARLKRLELFTHNDRDRRAS